MKKVILSNGRTDKTLDVNRETKCFIWAGNYKINKKTGREVGDWHMWGWTLKKVIGD